VPTHRMRQQRANSVRTGLCSSPRPVTPPMKCPSTRTRLAREAAPATRQQQGAVAKKKLD
jgi:hypothetical protein